MTQLLAVVMPSQYDVTGYRKHVIKWRQEGPRTSRGGATTPVCWRRRQRVSDGRGSEQCRRGSRRRRRGPALTAASKAESQQAADNSTEILQNTYSSYNIQSVQRHHVSCH